MKKVKQIGFIDHGTGKHQSNTVYDPHAQSPTVTTVEGGGTQQIKIIVAMRGRDIDDQYDTNRIIVAMRNSGRHDILSPKRTEYGKQIRKQYEKHEVHEKRKNMQQLEPRRDGLTNTITTVQKDNLLMEEQKQKHYRIRKLTPRECGRLMGVSDSDIDKMIEHNSNTQCYKQYGNSIVVPVLMAIFSQMNIKDVTAWNDMSEDEIYELIDKCSEIHE